METAHNVTVELKLTRERALACLVLLFLTWHPGFLGSETLTLTTYYPAPYGGYVSLLTTQNTYLARDGGAVAFGPGGTPALNMTGNGQTVKLDIRGGGIEMDPSLTIHSRGRMHIDGEEILYLLNNGGVVVSKAWNGNGDLTVEGTLRGLCRTTAYNFGSTTNCPGTYPYIIGHAPNSWYDRLSPLPSGTILDYVGYHFIITDYASGDVTVQRTGQGWSGSMTCCRMELW